MDFNAKIESCLWRDLFVLVITLVYWGWLRYLRHFFTVLHQSAWNKHLKCSLLVWTYQPFKSWLQNPNLQNSARANKDKFNTWMLGKNTLKKQVSDHSSNMKNETQPKFLLLKVNGSVLGRAKSDLEFFISLLLFFWYENPPKTLSFICQGYLWCLLH